MVSHKIFWGIKKKIASKKKFNLVFFSFFYRIDHIYEGIITTTL